MNGLTNKILNKFFHSIVNRVNANKLCAVLNKKALEDHKILNHYIQLRLLWPSCPSVSGSLAQSIL